MVLEDTIKQEEVYKGFKPKLDAKPQEYFREDLVRDYTNFLLFLRKSGKFDPDYASASLKLDNHSDLGDFQEEDEDPRNWGPGNGGSGSMMLIER